MRISCVAPISSFRAQALRFGLGVRLVTFAIAGALLLASPMPRAFGDPTKRKLLEHEDPQYPPQAKKMRVEGAVILRIVIEPDGHVSDVSVASGNPMLTEAAQDAAKHWKYSAAAESSVSFVQVNFNLK